MKKSVLIFSGLMCILNLFAQETINIFKSDLSVLNLSSSVIDSVKFSNANSQLDVFKSDNSTTGIDVFAIDSITFSSAVPANSPVLSTVAVSSILNTTVKCSFKLLSTGGTSVTEKGICWSTTENPSIENNKLVSATTSSASSVDVSGLTAQTPYFVRAYAINATGISYSDQATFTTANYTLPSIEIVFSTYDYNTNINRCTVRVPSNGGCALTERGICWSKTQNPTINNSKYSNGTSVGSFYANMTNLTLNTIYYVRPFATNCIGTYYGPQIKVQPLMGNVTYTLAQSVIDAGDRTYKLIKTAMDSACYYYNRYTPFRNNIWVTFHSGTPTAQASYHGSMQFGANERYMWVGTAMHEMAHYFGSGTTTEWKNLMVGGLWQGAVGKALCSQLTGQTLKGDNNNNPAHYWPTGINQREEVGSQTDLVNHAKIVKAMLVDDAKLPLSW